MTGREIAIEFTELWDSFDVDEINTMLAKNVSVELLEFFASYADQALGDLLPTDESGRTRDRLTIRETAIITLNAGGTRYRFRVPVGEEAKP